MNPTTTVFNYCSFRNCRYAVNSGFITGDTLYFNSLVQTKEELENNWIIL